MPVHFVSGASYSARHAALARQDQPTDNGAQQPVGRPVMGKAPRIAAMIPSLPRFDSVRKAVTGKAPPVPAFLCRGDHGRTARQYSQSMLPAKATAPSPDRGADSHHTAGRCLPRRMPDYRIMERTIQVLLIHAEGTSDALCHARVSGSRPHLSLRLIREQLLPGRTSLPADRHDQHGDDQTAPANAPERKRE